MSNSIVDSEAYKEHEHRIRTLMPKWVFWRRCTGICIAGVIVQLIATVILVLIVDMHQVKLLMGSMLAAAALLRAVAGIETWHYKKLMQAYSDSIHFLQEYCYGDR